jgi:hypothetical protein
MRRRSGSVRPPPSGVPGSPGLGIPSAARARSRPDTRTAGQPHAGLVGVAVRRTRQVPLPCIVPEETGRFLLLAVPVGAAPRAGVTRDRAAVRATCAVAQARNPLIVDRPAGALGAGRPTGGCQVRPFLRVRGLGPLLFPQQLGEARPANPGIWGLPAGRALGRMPGTARRGRGTAPEEAS